MRVKGVPASLAEKCSHRKGMNIRKITAISVMKGADERGNVVFVSWHTPRAGGRTRFACTASTWVYLWWEMLGTEVLRCGMGSNGRGTLCMLWKWGSHILLLATWLRSVLHCHLGVSHWLLLYRTVLFPWHYCMERHLFFFLDMANIVNLFQGIFPWNA